MKFTQGVKRLRRTSLTLAVMAAVCGSCTFDAGAAPAAGAGFATLSHPTTLSRGDVVTGALPMNEPIQVVVGLKLRNKTALDAFIANNAKGQMHGQPFQVMSRDRIMSDHAPTQAQAQAVARYLTRKGYRNVTIAPNRMLVTADGTAQNARDAFMTSFARVKTHDGRVAFANTGEVLIPAALQDSVQSVIGLQTVHQSHTYAKLLRTLGPYPNGINRKGGVHTNTAVVEAIDPWWLTSIYNTYGFLGARNTQVGIVSQGKLDQVFGDLENVYASSRVIPITVVTVNGTSTDTSNQVEWELDSQTIAGISGQIFTSLNELKGLTFYNIPTLLNTDLTLDFNKIETDGDVRIINVSLGECELATGPAGDGSAATDDGILALAVAQGQTFSISTGDGGVDECSDGGTKPEYPASSPYVVAVAGTRLTVDDDGTGHGPGPGGQPGYSSETEWSGSGGSESTFEPKPSWQTLWGGTHRGTADVAFDADPASGVLIDFGGSTAQAGGTSLAAPIFAGIWATLLTEKNNNAFGFAGPVIYGLPATDFHDITTGNNGGGNIAAGYDLESGRGSIIFGSTFISDTNGLGNLPPVANFSTVTAGLTVHFTDTSTDADGTIASHLWTFGDGSPTDSTANPNHTYAAAGTYSVRDQVRDNQQSVNAKVKPVTVNTNPVQLLKNTGFESGSSPWGLSSGVLQSAAGNAHAGTFYAQMGGALGGTQHVTQTVTIPAGYTSASMSFYLASQTASFLAPYDHLTVEVYSGSTLLATVASYSSKNASGCCAATPPYALQTVNMTPYIGQTITVKFIGAQPNTTAATYWDIDDVTLTATP